MQMTKISKNHDRGTGTPLLSHVEIKSKNTRRVFLCLVFLLVSLIDFAMPHKAQADDAACAHSVVTVDCFIKNDKNLAGLAEEMDKIYRQRKASMDNDEKEAIQNQQQHWLKFRAPSCGLSRHNILTEDKAKAVISCLKTQYRSRIDSLTYQCEVDDSHTVAEMETWKEPLNGKVPAGFKIDNHMVDFVVTPENLIATDLYTLPTSNSRTDGRLKYGYRDVADCRVQDPDGGWWLILATGGESLYYVPEEDTTPADKYYKNSEAENKAWQEQNKQYRHVVH